MSSVTEPITLHIYTNNNKKQSNKTILCSNIFQNVRKQSPYVRLDDGVHVVLFDGHGDQLVDDDGHLLALVLVTVAAEARQIGQPRRHVLQTQMLQQLPTLLKYLNHQQKQQNKPTKCVYKP